MASVAESRAQVPAGALSGVPPARLGERLAAFRHTRRLSLRHVARRAQLPAAALRDAERGRHPLGEQQLGSVLHVYNVTLPELLPERRSRPVRVDGRTVRTDDVLVMGAVAFSVTSVARV